MTATLAFITWGVPRPQGSLKLVSSNSGRGKPYLKNSDTLIVWRNSLVVCAEEAAEAQGWETLTNGPVRMETYFTFERPTSHSKRQQALDGGRRANGGDLDKLVRAVGDALTIAGVLSDDRLISDLVAYKRYAGTPGALIRPGVSVRVEDLTHRGLP